MRNSNKNAIPQRSRDAVSKRSGDRCEACGVHATEVHHRQRRREGGHAPENLILLCSTDHRWAHANPRLAEEAGLIVPTYVSVDAIGLVAVRTYMGWVTFGDTFYEALKTKGEK